MSTGRRGVRVPFWMRCVSTFSAHTSVAAVTSLNHLTVGTGSSCQFFAQCAHTCLAASPLEQVSGPSETEQRAEARERLAQSATRPPGHGQAGFAVPWSPSAGSGSPAHPCWGLDVLTGSREPPALNLCGWTWWGSSTAQLWRATSRSSQQHHLAGHPLHREQRVEVAGHQQPLDRFGRGSSGEMGTRGGDNWAGWPT